jgi:hypothetical protein
MTTPKTLVRRLKYGQIPLACITLLLILGGAVNAQCAASSNSQEKTSAETTKENADKSTKENADKTKSESGTDSQGSQAKPAPSPTPFPLTVKEVKVPSDEKNRIAGLGDEIVVVVDCLKEELARQENPKSGVPAQERLDPNKFVLFLNDVEMKKLHPFAVNRDDDALHFRLRRDADTRDAWLNFLASPKSETMEVNASVGLEDKSELRQAKPFWLRLYHKKLLYWGIVLFSLFLIAFVLAAKYTTIIRDSGPPMPVGGPIKRPYSLARAQMAWWFFIILGSFFFIAMVTWDLDTITSSSLVLLGIGTGTALGAAMVDANKRENSDRDLRTLKPQEAKLEATVADLKTKINDGATKLTENANQPELAASLAAMRTQLAAAEAELEQVKLQVDDAVSGLEKPTSEGPIEDLLSDVNGVTLHRFQILVWTIVLGMIFIVSVYKTLTMPQFSDTLLALMGISAGTYIGFKIPEKQTDPKETNQGATGTPGNQANTKTGSK